MKSPFAIFRKHQRVLTVVLTGLAMFAFVILGSLGPGQEMSPAMMILVGAVVGAGSLWFVGTFSDRPKEFSMMGAVLGGLLMFVVFREAAPSAPVVTKIGSFTENELNEMIARTNTANNFLSEAWRATVYEDWKNELKEWEENKEETLKKWEAENKNGGTEPKPTAPQEPEPSPGLFFQISNSTALAQRDVIRSALLRHEAELIGAVVNDDAVANFVNGIANSGTLEGEPKKIMPASVFAQICVDMNIGQEELFDILRGELQVRLAAQLLVPQSTLTPEQYWEMYRKVNVRQELDVATVSLAPFTADLEEPPETQLRKFFEDHKSVFPNQAGPGEPGFRQPTRVQIAYLEADYSTFEKRVEEPTDADIAADYEQYPFKAIPDDASDTAGDGDEPITPELTPDEKPEDSGDEKPAENEKGAENDKKAAAPKTDDNPPADAKAKQPADDKKDTPAKDAPVKDVPVKKEGAPKDAPKSEETSPKSPASDDQARGIDLSQTVEIALVQKEEQDEKPAEKAADEKPADEKAADEKAAEEKSAAEKSADKTPYQPLDDELKDEIRERLLEQRTRDLMEKEIDAAYDALFDLDLPFADGEAEDRDKAQAAADEESREMVLKAMEALAGSKTGLKLVKPDEKTPWVSYTEFRKTDEIPAEDPDTDPIVRNRFSLAGASEPGQNAFMGGGPSVAERIFSGQLTTFLPMRAVGTVDSAEGLLENNFLYVLVGAKDQHVAEFTDSDFDPPVQEQVFKSWKLSEVRKRAEERAQELAEKVRKGGEKSMFEILSEEKIDGKEADSYDIDGETVSNKLVVLPTPAFSWLRSSTAMGANPMFSQLEFSTIPGVEPIGSDFMKYVFQELDEGKVGVVANADRSAYYVVKVKNRSPKSIDGEPSPTLTRGYMNSSFSFFPPPMFAMNPQFSSMGYNPLIQQHRQELTTAWLEQLDKKYEVQWLTETEDEPQP